MYTDLPQQDLRGDLAYAARRATSHLVKSRARHYHRRPSSLEALYPGLSLAQPETLVAIAVHLVERERRSPRRWFGFGGEISLINAQAALLLGRAERRQRRRDEMISGIRHPEVVVPLQEP